MVGPVKTITRITRYGDDDPEGDCDYYEIILKAGKKTLATFGDSYHDRGWERADGFIQGLRVVYPDLKVVEKRGEDYPL
jgi:hypothetical protein